MKKILVILLACAAVTSAYAQKVSVKNTVSTEPKIYIDGKNKAANQWGFQDRSIREEVQGNATTEDGRAKIWARVRFDVNFRDGTM